MSYNNKDDMSLDDILTSIRTVVMDKKPDEEEVDNIKAKNNSSNSDIIPPIEDGSLRESTMRAEQRFQSKPPPESKLPVDKTPAQLSDIMELGNLNATPPMVSGRASFEVEESIKEILEILNQNKNQLPPEFFRRQNDFIKTWLNGHLPQIVEKVVQKEISRIFKYVYNNR